MATMTPEQQAYADATKQFREQKWSPNGTVNGLTENQNLAAVIQQPGNTTSTKATPYITADGTTDYHITGQPDTVGAARTPIDTPQDTSQNGIGSGISNNQDSGLGNAQDYINQLNDLRKNAALGALQKSHDAALSNMGAEKSAIQPKYYDQRNQVAAGAQQQARNFAEYMANRGGASSGANAQAELSRNIGTQGAQGALGRQEAQAYTDIERRTSDLNNAYQSDVATTTANAEADKMSALLNDYYKAQERGDVLAQNKIQNAISQQQLEIQKQTAEVNNQGQSLNNQLSQLKLTDYPAESQNAAKLIQQQLTAGSLSNEAAKYNLDQLKDPNSPTNQAAKLDLDMKKIDSSNYSQEAKLKLEQLQKTIAEIGKVHKTPQSEADIAADKVKLAVAKKQLDDIAKGIYPSDKTLTPDKPMTSEVYQANLKPVYDAHGKLTNAQQLEDQIILSGMSEWEQYKSYKANGIEWTDPIPTKPN